MSRPPYRYRRPFYAPRFRSPVKTHSPKPRHPDRRQTGRIATAISQIIDAALLVAGGVYQYALPASPSPPPTRTPAPRPRLDAAFSPNRGNSACTLLKPQYPGSSPPSLAAPHPHGGRPKAFSAEGLFRRFPEENAPAKATAPAPLQGALVSGWALPLLPIRIPPLVSAIAATPAGRRHEP
jgi:hypothetical protein